MVVTHQSDTRLIRWSTDVPLPAPIMSTWPTQLQRGEKAPGHSQPNAAARSDCLVHLWNRMHSTMYSTCQHIAGGEGTVRQSDFSRRAVFQRWVMR